jgi:uncharacterized membrane protein
MNNAVTIDVELTGHRASRWSAVILSAVALVAIVFVVVAALPYFNPAAAQWTRYSSRRWWLLVHISTGIVALLTGPVQLWLGLAQQRIDVHRRLGVIYMASVVASAVSAYYLAFNTTLGFIFAAGLTGLATAWLLTTALALVAIKRRQYDQHKEWMIRSYVVTTAFVTFRVFFNVLGIVGVGTRAERAAMMAWFCWAIPLLLTEAILQGRKIVSR